MATYKEKKAAHAARAGIAEIKDFAGFDVAAFDLDDDAFCFARIVINKNPDTINAFVRTFLARSPND